LGTNVQEVFDSFFAKCPETSFTGKETLVYQLFKSGIAHCYQDVSESLEYTFDEVTYEGYFTDTLYLDTIELIALCMKREFSRRGLDRYTAIKQHIGTNAFNKLPDIKGTADTATGQYKNLSDEIEDFKQDFYPYDK
jgi:hypothetical protein